LLHGETINDRPKVITVNLVIAPEHLVPLVPGDFHDSPILFPRFLLLSAYTKAQAIAIKLLARFLRLESVCTGYKRTPSFWLPF